MLQQLTIQNYALIEDIQIDFAKGFSIITGETGAGKSILLGALRLILGERADKKMFLQDHNKCVVEGVFDVSHLELQDFFEENDLEYEESSILRRIILPSGKSRAFVNDVPVTLDILKKLALRLIDVHSQHANLQLQQPHFGTELLDDIAQSHGLLQTYRQHFKQYQTLKKEYAIKQNSLLALKTEADFLRFQYDEFLASGIDSPDAESWEEDFDTLQYSEDIRQALAVTFEKGKNEAQNSIGEMIQALQKIDSFYTPSKEWNQRLVSLEIELGDILEEVQTKEAQVDGDEGRLADLQEKIGTLLRLKEKHHCNSLEKLREKKAQIEAHLSELEFSDEVLAELEKEIKAEEVTMTQLAQQLSQKRHGSIPQIEKTIQSILQELGMKEVQLSLAHDETDFTEWGRDRFSFLFSASANRPQHILHEVASGGELSRVMFALKWLRSQKVALPSIIFDEIDTGISGEIADKMGKMMREMSGGMQVISITHLPQIAGSGEHHYLVHKKSEAEKTNTHLQKLSQSERVEEIAKMLSGENVTEAARVHAQELLR